ncbi:hypothetical protein [Mucilaginibacter aquariorum]|uniref:Uncharacterized protein n=1 Tax=Mucilaginibacter aquariorum TaxID=2967225 RepID=A0ABT1T8X6_9SPHI|nr:hypothetical protein [Mucilaginibacter aquariorum]MCQ6960741.1 hypothetical protein [Mucilaginibacter aquariorum]
MKKVCAIAMLAVLMFNMGGYMLLFQYFINESDQFANEQIGKGYYKPEELVEIKIPVRMPYVQEQRQYENISGQIQLKGNCYNYVALKMTRDTMYVKCIPNYTKTKLVNDNVITAKEISDSPLAKKNHTPPVKKTGIDNEYNYTIALFDLAVPARALHTSFIYKASMMPNIYLSALGQPPDLTA